MKTLHERLSEGMEAGKFYGARAIMNILCPTQSTTAERLLQDAVCTGDLQEVRPPAGAVGRWFRINQ